VVPEDRVGADPPLPVIDDGALVVGAHQHHAAVELDQVVVGESFDLAVRNRFAVADNAPEVALSRENLRHRLESIGRAPKSLRYPGAAPGDAARIALHAPCERPN
jgi:hypothetical protein